MKKYSNRYIHNVLTESIQKLLLSEINDIYNSSLQDEDCPLMDKVFGNGFTLREMVSLNSAKRRINYASKTLDEIGSGLRRTVFRLNDKWILKLTNGDRRYQTKNEYDTSLLLSGKYSLLFPYIIYQARDFTWTISEYAKPLTESLCQSILHIPLYGKDPNTPSLEGFLLWSEAKARNFQNRQKMQNNSTLVYKQDLVDYHNCEEFYMKLVKSNEWFKQVFNLQQHMRDDLEYGLDVNPSGDDFRNENLGVVNRNGKLTIVLLDSGFIKPFDTRKLKTKFGIDSPQIPELNPNFT